MYIKANLSQEFINNIIDPVIADLRNLSIGFIDQLDPEAGLGCHPYHITLVGKINAEKTAIDITTLLNNKTKSIKSCKCLITGYIKITRNNTVLLRIKSVDLSNICKNICERLLDVHRLNTYNDYSNFNNDFHITLGKIFPKKYLNSTQDEVYFSEKIKNYIFNVDTFGWN